jgi:ABC-2 type transport system ATP-binding protein
MKDAKRTILITTHYIEEAEKLCDRVAIVDAGKVIALGTPRAIQAQTLGQTRIEVECVQAIPVAQLPDSLASEQFTLTKDERLLIMQSSQPAKSIVELVKWIDQRGLELADIHLKRPTLEDVFIELTGKKLRE